MIGSDQSTVFRSNHVKRGRSDDLDTTMPPDATKVYRDVKHVFARLPNLASAERTAMRKMHYLFTTADAPLFDDAMQENELPSSQPAYADDGEDDEDENDISQAEEDDEPGEKEHDPKEKGADKRQKQVRVACVKRLILPTVDPRKPLW